MRSPTICLAALLFLAACGGGSPAGPTPPPSDNHGNLTFEAIPYDAIGPNTIVFHRDAGTLGYGLVMIDGSAKSITTTYSHNGRDVFISALGNRITYVGAPPASESSTQRAAEVFVRDWSSNTPIPIAGPGGRRSTPSWSSDGSKILFAENDEYGLTPFRRIVLQSPVANAPDRQILWSAVGCETVDAPVQNQYGDLAFVYYPGASVACSLHTTIAVKTPAGAVKIVYDNPADPATNYRPVWSPDGSEIAFLQNDRDQTDPNSIALRLNVIAADGSRLRTYELPIHAFVGVASPSLCWAGDGSRLFVALGTAPLVSHIYSIRADGTGFTAITSADVADAWVSCE